MHLRRNSGFLVRNCEESRMNRVLLSVPSMNYPRDCPSDPLIRPAYRLQTTTGETSAKISASRRCRCPVPNLRWQTCPPRNSNCLDPPNLVPQSGPSARTRCSSCFPSTFRSPSRPCCHALKKSADSAIHSGWLTQPPPARSPRSLRGSDLPRADLWKSAHSGIPRGSPRAHSCALCRTHDPRRWSRPGNSYHALPGSRSRNGCRHAELRSRRG